jgi:hypothetical protein
MGITVGHAKSVTIADSADSNIVRPSDWNSTHAITFSPTGNELIGAFADANGISFGTNVGSALTASYTVPTQSYQPVAFSAANGSATASTVIFANSNGVSFSTGTQGVYATVATNYQSQGAYLTTARASNDAVGLNTALTAGPLAWTVNSSGISLNAGSAAGTSTGFAGNLLGGSMTHNTAGLNISLNHPDWLTTAAQSSASNVSAVYAGTNATGGTATLSGGVSFSNANGISFYTSAGNAVVGTVNTAYIPLANSNNYFYTSNNTFANSTHSHGNPTLNLTNINGTTASASNGLTLSLSAVVPAQSSDPINLYAVGNTTQSSQGTGNVSALSFNGAGIASVGVTGNSVVISVPSGGGAGDGYNIVSLGTVGTTGTAWSSLSASVAINGSGVVIVSQNNSNQIVISAPYNAWELEGANTAGTTVSTYTHQLYLSGGNNVTLSGNSNTIVISAAAGGAGATVTQRFGWPPGNFTAVAALGNGSYSINRMQVPGAISATRMDVPFLVSLASSAIANTWGFAATCFGAIYTKNVSTLSSLSSGSVSFSFTLASNSAGSTQVIPHAIRPFSIPINVNMSAGEYYIGFGISTNTSSVGTATTALGNTFSIMGGPIYSSAVPQVGDFSATTNATSGLWGGQGIYTAAISTVPPAVSLSAISQSGSYYARANFGIIFRNI